MSIYAIITGLSSLSCFLTGLFVYTRNPHQPLYQRCFIFTTSVAVWALGYYVTLLGIDNYSLNIFSSRLSHAFGALIPITYLHFVWVLLKNKNRKNFFLWAYVLSLSMFLLSLTPLVVRDVVAKMHMKYYPDWGILYPLYASLFVIFAGYAQIELAREIRSVHGGERTRLVYFFIVLTLAFSGGISLFLLIFNILFPPYFSTFILLFPPMMAYTILVHKFLDIEVIIRKTLIFAGLFAMAMIVVSAVSAVMQGYVGKYWTVNPNISTMISVLLAIVLYKPTRDLLVAVTDKFLFQKKSEIKVILNRLSERIITIVDMEQIGKTILSTLEETLRLESGMIFLKNKKLGNYRMLEHFGMTGDELTGSIKVLIDDPEIIRHFSDKGMAILNLDHPDKRIGLPPAVSSWLKISKSRVCIPLLINEDQFGLMVLGEKKSDQEFTQEEMDFFPTIASQSALAIRNASLFETVLEEREFKLKAQDEAKRAHYAQTVAHEIKNKLVSINMPGHSLATHYVPNLKDIFERFYKDKAPQAVDKKYLQICDKLEHMGKELQSTASEIFVTAKTAQYDLEEDREVLVTISVNLIWQSAIHESGVKDIHFDIEMPDDFKADANPTLFKAVLVNLLTNARDALTEQTDKRIEFKCRYDQIESQRVAYFELRDNGPGILREIQEKIFLKGFSTKKKPVQMDYRSSGSGYGLYVCKETIENWHHGKIWIESEPGKGTAFKFWLPFKKDNLQEKEPK